MSQRLFFALQPSKAAIQKISELMRQTDETALKFYQPENLHQTLVFLGETQTSQLAALVQQVNALEMRRFVMQFTQLAYWPKPKIVCLTSSAISEELTQLVSTLETIATMLDFQIQKRPYRPHITLARKANQAVNWDLKPIIFEAKHFVLMASTPSENGVQYVALHRWALS